MITPRKPSRLADIMKEERQRRGRTLEQVARGAAIKSSEFIHLVENNKRSMPLDRVPRLASALNLNRSELTNLALYEHHPRAYIPLFGNQRPAEPECWDVAD